MDASNADRAGIGKRAQSFFDELWRHGDNWELESSAFEQAKYARALALLADRRYRRVLEVGCGAGAFTRLLAGLSDYVLALDVSAVAIARARAATPDPHLDFRVINIMEDEPEINGSWDLVVINETIYYLGWLYSFFDVSWLAVRMFGAAGDRGRVLMANTFGDDLEYIMRPPVIRTYRDLFVNAGFRIEQEEVFHGTKDNVPLDVLISVFEKPSPQA